MRRVFFVFAVLFAFVSTGLLFAGGGAEEDVLYLNIVWHQHQPLYYMEQDVYSRPWVRVHATKDYYDMVSVLEDYPDVHVTFNITPVLIKQLEDFVAGKKDTYWVLGEKNAAELTLEEKRFILERFFDANHDNLIKPFPRYWELMKKRDSLGLDKAVSSFSEQDFRDLQVWFQLAWCDPVFRDKEPLASLVKKGRGFTEEDKAILFSEISHIIKMVLPEHRKLMEKGQIELITTPYAHPILPLIYSTKVIKQNDPSSPAPETFSYPNDAIAHLKKAREIYQRHFGREPKGMWPAEGSVSKDIIPLVEKAGFSWMASGEQVLAKSLGLDGFTRDANDTVEQAAMLYRPYYALGPKGQKVAMVFRDNRLSDLIGFEYSGMSGKAAVDDLFSRLKKIKNKLDKSGEKGPFLVSIILDGENAWEHYKNDGKDFFAELYSRLSSSDWVRTVTPSEFLEMFPEQKTIDNLWPGSWFTPDYSTWIGEEEENRAWNLLGFVRAHLAKYDMYHYREAEPDALAQALDYMYLAEGSDWFWWYGDDQDSGVDEYFDNAYRELLKNVYRSLGDPVPAILDVPIIAERAARESESLEKPVSVLVDGNIGADEWKGAGRFVKSGGVQAAAYTELNEIRYGVSKKGLTLGITSRNPWNTVFTDASLELYFKLPNYSNSSVFMLDGKSPVGFDASHVLVIDSKGYRWFAANDNNEWTEEKAEVAIKFAGRGLELEISYASLPPVEMGQAIRIKSFLTGARGVRDSLPANANLVAVLPDTGQTETLLSVSDPAGDDFGPGYYTYPQDAVFEPGVFDITDFSVSQGANDIVFTFKLASAVNNPWNSPIGLSVQTFDIYLDVVPGQGARNLLEGRNVKTADDFAWDYAIWVEGWNQKIMLPADPSDPESGFAESAEYKPRVMVQSASGKVTIRIPRAILGDAKSFKLAACVLGQEGFPSAGVRRVRNVAESASQWSFGGAKSDDYTRIIDLVSDDAESQKKQLESRVVSYYEVKLKD